MTDTKNTPAKTEAKPKVEAKTDKPAPKAKRPQRTYAERIAELQAAEAKAAEKRKAKGKDEFDTVVEKRERAAAQVAKFDDQLRALSATHGFALPEGVRPPTQTEVERAEVAESGESRAEAEAEVGTDGDDA